jgi:hypothetical protein
MATSGAEGARLLDVLREMLGREGQQLARSDAERLLSDAGGSVETAVAIYFSDASERRGLLSRAGGAGGRNSAQDGTKEEKLEQLAAILGVSGQRAHLAGLLRRARFSVEGAVELYFEEEGAPHRGEGAARAREGVPSRGRGRSARDSDVVVLGECGPRRRRAWAAARHALALPAACLLLSPLPSLTWRHAQRPPTAVLPLPPSVPADGPARPRGPVRPALHARFRSPCQRITIPALRFRPLWRPHRTAVGTPGFRVTSHCSGAPGV